MVSPSTPLRAGGPALRIVFFGTPAFAVPALERLLASPHSVAAVVTQPDRPRGRGHRRSAGPVKALAVAHGVALLQPERIRDASNSRDYAFHDALRALRADLGVVAAYGRILPDAVLAVPRLGFVNIHASLLPKYRGASPIQRAVIAGERETGVSIMRVVRALDAGPVFAARARPIGAEETAEDVERDLARLGADLLIEVIEAIARGDAVERPQDDAAATYAGKLTKEDAWLDWTEPARRLHDRVRGLRPWPTACTSLHGRRYLILRSQPLDDVAGAAPGTILEANGDALVAAAGGGTALRLLQIQPEGKRVLSAREFLAGHKVRVGDHFEGGPRA